MSADTNLTDGINPTPQQSGGFSADGTGSVTASLGFSGGTPEGPGFEWSGTLTVPAGNIYTISVSADDSATVFGGGISASSHWDATAKKIVPGGATSDYAELPANPDENVEFSISYSNAGGPYSLSVSVTSTRCVPEKKQPETDDGDEKCECPTQCSGNCDMASKAEVKSVHFEQPFGSTPFAAGFRKGALVLKKATADGELFSPLGLKYDHLLARRVTAKDAGTQSATISADGLWENAYANGVPAPENAWKNSQIRVNADGTVEEFLSDRTKIAYDAAGNFSSATSPAGVTLTAAQLGVDVVRDAATGALRQIWSLADGLLDIVSTGARRYEIRWHKHGDFSGKNSDGLYEPTGDPIKVFECGAPEDGAANVFVITEKRGSQFSFEYRWTFNPGNSEWILDRGNEVRISRAWTKNEAGNFVVTETKTAPAAGTRAVAAFVSEEEIAPANGSRIVGKTVGGVAEYSATRVSGGNGLGKIASETDRAGAKRTYAYDAAGRVSRETLSRGFAGETEETFYSYAPVPAGEFADLRPRTAVLKIAGAVFRTETFLYDDDFENGREETRAVAANGETLTSRTLYYPANAGTVGAGRVKLEIRADGTATLHEYSAVSIPSTVGMSSNLGYTETVTEGVFADGEFSPVPGKSTRRIRTFDTRGNVLAEYGNASYPVKYAYDAFGQKTRMRTFRALAGTPEDPSNLDDAAGDLTAWTYDAATGVLLSKTDAAGATVNYSYTAALLLASRAWARGLTTAYAYDAWNQLAQTSYSDGTPSVSQTCDALGRVVSVTDAAGTAAYQYDAYGSRVSETRTGTLYSTEKTLAFHFDAFGRDVGYSIDGERKTTVSYDPATGRIASCACGNASFSWEYLAGTDLKSKLTYPNGATAEWTYEADRDLLAGVTNTVNGNVISQYAYVNDALGRRTSMTKSGTMMSESETLAYGYNSRSELVSAVSDTDSSYAYAYAFDAIGNRTSSSESGSALAYSANSLNQYSTIGRSGVSPLPPDAGTQNNPSSQSDVPAPQGIAPQSASSPEATGTSLLPFAPTYDADGNMTLIRTSTGTWTVEYNGENRPVTWTKSTGEKICMMYDAQGRRVEKRVLNAAGVRTLRERCVYVGYTCVQVLNGDNGNAVVKEFAWDPTEPVATRPLMFKYVPNGVTLFYAFDGNKNISDVFCWAVQNGVPAHYDYAPFGAITRTSKNTPFTLDLLSLNPWRFSSEFYDSELDLIYYNYRHYSPSLGRFLSRDPIEEQGGLNLYAFVGNCPLNKNDNLGFVAPVPPWLVELLRKYGAEILKYLAEELVKSYMFCDGGAVVGSVINFYAKVKTERQCSVPRGAQVPKWYFCASTSGESRGFAKFICRSNFPLPLSWEFLEWISAPDPCGSAPSCAAGCCSAGCSIKVDSIENVYFG